ncbi:MAG: M23 family metallopeptidase [Treponema sp.]|nr:M23 family metallopeptidase [Treponema sp.]
MYRRRHCKGAKAQVQQFRYLVIICALVAHTVHGLYGMDWPSPKGRMVNNFGWNDGGTPVLGISFEAEGTIQAAETGELLFMHRGLDTASRLPAPLGAWIALDHGDGIISIYSRFDDTRQEEVQKMEKFEKNTPLGEAGLSGSSVRKGFHFSLFDRKERRWVNPMMIISPPADTRPPVILSIRMQNTEGKLIDPGQVKTISQGRYRISVTATDTLVAANENPLAPYRLVCSVNGNEIGALNFETYAARDGVLMMYRNGLVPVKQIYGPFPAFEVGETWFTRGQGTLEISALDISGNVQSILYRLQVE